MRIIGYERVSTARQGASGLGIAAQRQAIDGFVAQRNADLIARFTEVESGRNPDRPELQKALHLAKVTGATLVIASHDARILQFFAAAKNTMVLALEAKTAGSAA